MAKRSAKIGPLPPRFSTNFWNGTWDPILGPKVPEKKFLTSTFDSIFTPMGRTPKKWDGAVEAQKYGRGWHSLICPELYIYTTYKSYSTFALTGVFGICNIYSICDICTHSPRVGGYLQHIRYMGHLHAFTSQPSSTSYSGTFALLDGLFMRYAGGWEVGGWSGTRGGRVETSHRSHAITKRLRSHKDWHATLSNVSTTTEQ